MGELATGAVIGGRYRIDSHLATGGMGTVYATSDVRTGKRYAVKVLHAKFAKVASLVDRFKREALLLDSVTHPGVVNIHDCAVTDDGSVFIALDLLQGETLQQLMDRSGPLEPWALAPIVRGICDALTAVHAHGLVHRDVKPSNIFLVEAVGGPIVKLIDFGIAKAANLERLTSLGQVLGTPNYMAPEQLAGDLHADERTDVYAVGVVIYRALAGQSPWTGDRLRAISAILASDARPLASLRPHLSQAVVREVMRAMSLTPRERHSSAQVLADAFEHAVGSAGDQTVPNEPPLVDVGRSPAAAAIANAAPARGAAPDIDPVRPSFAVDPPPGGARFSFTGAPPEPSERKSPPARRRRAGLAWLLGCAGLSVVGLVALGVAALVLWPRTRAAVAPARVTEPPRVVATPDPPPHAEAPAEPPTAAPSMSATIRIVTVPSDATVTRGDEHIGRTPVDVPRPVEPDGYELTLTKRGRVEERVRVVPLSSDVVTVKLRTVPRARTPRGAGGSRPIIDPWQEGRGDP